MGTTRSTHRRQQMFAMVESCLNSGMTRKQFCHKHGISRTRFYYWKRYHQEQKADAGFLPVQISGVQSAGDIEIRRRDRVKLLRWESGGFVLYYKRLERGTRAFCQDRKRPASH